MTASSRRKPKIPDCQTCGACCGPLYQQDGFVDLEQEDLERMPRKYRLHVVGLSPIERLRAAIAGQSPRPILGTKQSKSNGCVCVALRGRIGENVSCDMYEERPGICRTALQPGDRTCTAIRRDVLGHP